MGNALRQAGRATVHLALVTCLTSGLYLFIPVLVITAVAALMAVGAWVVPEVVLVLRRIAGTHRRMTAEWTGREIPEAYQAIDGSLRVRLRTAVHDPGTLRDLRWMIALCAYGVLVPPVWAALWPLGLIVDGVWCGLLRRKPFVLPLISKVADMEARWSTALLRPSPRALLAARVEALATTRAEAIAAHEAELRRIERDLHDGAQARLVALSMRLGLADRAFDRDPQGARRLMTEAHSQAQEALLELRQVVRGIHPPILTDRGLVGAVRALAASCGLEVAVEVKGGLEEGPRPPAAVEAAAYFMVAEALTNAAKHGGGMRAEVHLERVRAGLRAVVQDDGRGGADEDEGTGLPGIRRRVAALDGTMGVSSPPGGPTVIEVQLPCVW